MQTMQTVLIAQVTRPLPKSSPASYAQAGTASSTAPDRGLQPNAASAATRAIVH